MAGGIGAGPGRPGQTRAYMPPEPGAPFGLWGRALATPPRLCSAISPVLLVFKESRGTGQYAWHGRDAINIAYPLN